MHFRRLRNKDWEKIEERIEKKVEQLKREIPVGRRYASINQFSTGKFVHVHALFFLGSERCFGKKLITSSPGYFGKMTIKRKGID
jgi:hypothetical protein